MSETDPRRDETIIDPLMSGHRKDLIYVGILAILAICALALFVTGPSWTAALATVAFVAVAISVAQRARLEHPRQ